MVFVYEVTEEMVLINQRVEAEDISELLMMNKFWDANKDWWFKYLMCEPALDPVWLGEVT